MFNTTKLQHQQRQEDEAARVPNPLFAAQNKSSAFDKEATQNSTETETKESLSSTPKHFPVWQCHLPKKPIQENRNGGSDFSLQDVLSKKLAQSELSQASNTASCPGIEDAYGNYEINSSTSCTSETLSAQAIEQKTRELMAANAELQYQVMVLSSIPDPVVAINTSGQIKFCSEQMGRVLRHDIEDVEGANIEDIMVPASREKFRRLIQDLVISSAFVESQRNDLDSMEANAISCSERSYPISELIVNYDSAHIAGQSSDPIRKRKSSSTSLSSLTDESLSLLSKIRAAGNKRPLEASVNLEPQETVSSTNSSSNKTSQHQPSIRRQVMKRDRSMSELTEVLEESVDSGYKNSEGSLDDYNSSFSSPCERAKKKGRRRHPLAPACTVWLIRNDLVTIFCEVTSSIRIDNDGEIELFFCFRPFYEGEEVGEELRFRPMIGSSGRYTDC